MPDVILLPLQDFDEDMKLRDDDKDWLRKEMASQVKEAISEVVGTLRPHGARRVIFWLREWGLAATAIATPLALLGMLITVSIFAASGMTKNTAFQTRTEDRLKIIEDTIVGIRGDLAKQSMINHASLPLSDFKANLPDLGVAIATARQQQAKVSPTIISDLQQKLVATAGTNASAVESPNFWPTAAEFISYRSEVTTGNFKSSAGIPNCTDSDPNPFKVTEVGPIGNVKKIANAYYENCRFTLDSPQDDSRINTILEKKFPTIEFRHCLIIYRGGDFTLITYRSMKDVPTTATKGSGKGLRIDYNGPALQFVQCLFDFSMSNNVPKNGQELTRLLLAQGQSSLSIPISPRS